MVPNCEEVIYIDDEEDYDSVLMININASVCIAPFIAKVDDLSI